MANFDEIKNGLEAAIDQAKPVVEGAFNAGKEKAAELAEKANEWASDEHPAADKVYEAVGNVATGAVSALADGAGVAYEFLKDKAEEMSRKDIDGDGMVGKEKAEDGASEAEQPAEEAIKVEIEVVEDVAEEAAPVEEAVEEAAPAEEAAEEPAPAEEAKPTEEAAEEPAGEAAPAEE